MAYRAARAPPTPQPEEPPQLPPDVPIDIFPVGVEPLFYVCRKTITQTDHANGMIFVGQRASQFFNSRSPLVRERLLNGTPCTVLLENGKVLDCIVRKEGDKGSLKFLRGRGNWDSVIHHAELHVGTTVDCWVFPSPTETDLIFVITRL